MKSERQIKAKFIELMKKVDDAECCVKGDYENGIFPTFSSLRHAKSVLTTLRWVLGKGELE